MIDGIVTDSVFFNFVNRYNIWHRNGEPVWTEMLRMIVKFISFVILCLFAVYCYNNIAESTISTTSDIFAVPNMTYPGTALLYNNVYIIILMLSIFSQMSVFVLPTLHLTQPQDLSSVKWMANQKILTVREASSF